MEVYVRIKALGKRQDILAPTPYGIPDHIASLRQLLTAVVQQEVARYNRKEPGVQLIPFLSAQELEDQAAAGKIGFGRVWSDRKADPQKAVTNAIQCFEDGLVRVLMNDRTLTALDEPLTVPPGATLTFIRLTFLAGSFW